MKKFDFLRTLREIFGHPAQPCGNEVHPCDEVREAVDLVVKLSHPNIHYVPHYRKMLMPAVELTLKYADELITQLSGPVPVKADSYDTDPFIRTVFSDDSQFRKFFSEHGVLKEFFQKAEASRCCALLVMTHKEKKVFGIEMEGEIMKRDVLQTSIDFSDHQLVAPMVSEEETRKELALRALALLASHSLEEILSLIAWKKELETEKRILEVKLQIRNAHIYNRKSLLPDISDKVDQTSEVF